MLAVSGALADLGHEEPTSDSSEHRYWIPTTRDGLGAVAVGDRIYALAGGTQPGSSAGGLNEVFIVLDEGVP